MRAESGNADLLGAIHDGDGTNFALFSAHAERVELCLFDTSGQHQIARLDLPQKTDDIWHGYLPGVAPGTAYGYRVHGPYQPQAGLRFNPHKLLLDPYARELLGKFVCHDSHFGYRRDAREDLEPDPRDNAVYLPKAVVVVPAAPAEHPRQPRTPWHRSVIYELHVRGFSMTHPELPQALRGTFSGLAHPRIIDYLKALGVTSVELLPVQAFVDEPFLAERGLRNYWGYNTLNYFTPQPSYLGPGGRQAFREFVDRFHDAGLEVILDVVYNHTAEGSHRGPTLSFRGIDNLSYYQLMPTDPSTYINDSGCGNTLNIRHPRVLQLVLDSLRYWAGELGVDGFRFDLATVLGRDEYGFSADAPFFRAIAKDPLLSRCKLIAEPWDLGPDGYQLGHFPPDFGEWNDRFRDTLRRYWRGDSGQLPELARRLHGSGDIFEHRGRKPHASINFFASHDGFTLRDLVSYNHRDNHANLEANNDGHGDNLSFNHGCEGPSDDTAINDLRLRQQRNFLATLLLAQGVPMLQAGDELGRSQGGNNNAYCQDNPISWIDWPALDNEARALIDYTSRLLTLRQACRVLHADRFRHHDGLSDDDSIQWFNCDGGHMRDLDWHRREGHALGYLLIESEPHGGGNPRLLLVLFNAGARAQAFRLPLEIDADWHLLFDTNDAAVDGTEVAAASSRMLAPKSMQILSTSYKPDPG